MEEVVFVRAQLTDSERLKNLTRKIVFFSGKDTETQRRENERLRKLKDDGARAHEDFAACLYERRTAVREIDDQ